MDTSLALIVVKIMFMTFIVSWIGIMVILDNKILNKTVVNDVRVRALVTGAGAITFMAFIVSLSFRLQSDGGTGLGAIARVTAQVSSYFFFFVAGAIIGARVMRLACKGCEIRLSDMVESL